MKLRPDPQYRSAAIYAFGVVMFTVALILLLANTSGILGAFGKLIDICKPLIYGVCFAYLLFPLQRPSERICRTAFCKKKDRPRLCRALSVALTYLLVLALLTLLFAVIVPQLASGYEDLEGQITTYLSDSTEWLDTLLNDKLKLHFAFPTARQIEELPASPAGVLPDLTFRTVKQAQDNATLQAILRTVNADGKISVSALMQKTVNGLYRYLSDLAPQILDLAMSVLTETKNILIGLIISVYFLLSRERCLRAVRVCVRALLPEKHAGKLLRAAGRLNTAFFRFVTEKIADALIVFLLYTAVLSLLGFPYVMLVSTVMAVSNLIPYIGPFIGAIPAAFVVFAADPSRTVWFLLIVIVVQALDLYVIEGKLLNSRGQLSPAWVLISVTVLGSFWGAVGFFVAVPLTAVAYQQICEWLDRRLSAKGLPTDTADYLDPAAKED